MNPRRTTGQVLFTILALVTVGSLVLGLVAAAIFDAVSSDGAPGSGPEPGQADEIEVALRETAAADPQSADATAALASYLANTGKGVEAIETYEAAVALDPDDASTRLAFARSLVDLGYPQDAEFQFQESIRLDDADPQAHYYLAELYGDWSPPRIVDAVREYQATIERGPGTFVAEQAAAELETLLPASPGATPDA